MTILKDEKGRTFCDECKAYMRPHGFGCVHLYPNTPQPPDVPKQRPKYPTPEPEPKPERKPRPGPSPVDYTPPPSNAERKLTALEGINNRLDAILGLLLALARAHKVDKAE